MKLGRRAAKWLTILGLLALCASVPLCWVMVPLYTYSENMKLCNSIAPDIQSVAEKPVRCDAGYTGISVTASESDFEKVCDKVQEMIGGGRIGCSVNVRTEDVSRNTHLGRGSRR